MKDLKEIKTDVRIFANIFCVIRYLITVSFNMVEKLVTSVLHYLSHYLKRFYKFLKVESLQSRVGKPARFSVPLSIGYNSVITIQLRVTYPYPGEGSKKTLEQNLRMLFRTSFYPHISVAYRNPQSDVEWLTGLQKFRKGSFTQALIKILLCK